MRNAALAAGGNVEAGTPESGMIAACRLHDARAGCGMHIAFRGSDPVRLSRGSSASPTPASSCSLGGQKNGLRDLRPGAARLVRVRLAVMDMWKPFRRATARHAPQASILFDKFHILRHLGEALDQIRKSEYARVSGRQRRFIKGQKYTLLAHRENLTLDGRRALKTLLAANKRLNTAYLLKESFGQLWDYGREGWARRFFEHWRAALKWQRLRPYEKFAAMIDRHWDGIAAYCRPDNKVALGFVEGLNNKVRVLQRRAYGLRDEEYLRLKILTCMLPAI